MEKELTNQERAKIFGMYLGCEYIADDEYAKKVHGVTIDALLAGRNKPNRKLLLTPLEKITDEDAIEVGKIFNSEYEWKVTSRDNSAITTECHDYIIVLWYDDSSLIDFLEKYEGEENIKAHGGVTGAMSSYNIIEIIDYLRSKGYALPYKGIDLFKAGIAIEKQ